MYLAKWIAIGIFGLVAAVANGANPDSSTGDKNAGDFQSTPSTQPTTKPARTSDVLVVTGVIDAPIDEVWTAMTTADGVVKSWGVAQAKVDFRVGGAYRTAYTKDVDLDSDRCIVNTILAYEPMRSIVVKPTPPAGAPEWLTKICASGGNVFRFDPLPGKRTRVTLTGVGYTLGDPDMDVAYDKFKAGNEWTMQKMQKALGQPHAAERTAKAFALMKSATTRGGEWHARQTLPDGRVLRGRTVWQSIFDGKFVRIDGMLGDEKHLAPHALFVCGIEPAGGGLFCNEFMDDGAVSRSGGMTLLDERTVGSYRTFDQPGGKTAGWYVSFEFVDDDHYISRMWRNDEPEGDPVITLRYSRAAPSATTESMAVSPD